MLEAIFLLHKYEFLDNHLRPNEIFIKLAILGKPYDQIKKLPNIMNDTGGNNPEGGNGKGGINGQGGGGNAKDASKNNQPNNNLAQNAGTTTNSGGGHQHQATLNIDKEQVTVTIDDKNKVIENPKIEERQVQQNSQIE